jgi:hypothetical protein
MDLENVVLHIGKGKCGSSAIQLYCAKYKAILEEQGVGYCGLFFEELTGLANRTGLPIGVQNYRAFLGLPLEDRIALSSAFVDELSATAAGHFPTLFLSNEGLENDWREAKPLIDALARRFAVKFVLFLRNPIEFMWSAYLQWGLKYKDYAGEVRDADTWIRDNLYRVDYARLVWQLQANFPHVPLTVLSYDDCPDVVRRCLLEVGIVEPPGETKETVNETPSSTIHSVFKIANNQAMSNILPQELLGMLDRGLVLTKSYRPTEIQTAPVSAEVVALVNRTAYRYADVLRSALSEEQNPKFYERKSQSPSTDVSDVSTLMALMIDVIGRLDQRISALEMRLGQRK